MRYAIAAAILTACAPALPPSGVAGTLEVGGRPEVLTACRRDVVRGAASTLDTSVLVIASASHELEASWRGEVDRWYPVTVPATVDGVACRLTIDVAGAWIVSGQCGGVEVYAEATACE